MNRGVLYIASGASYIDDATQSAMSVKKHSDLPITLVADRDVQKSVFDTVIESTDFCYHYGDSVLQIPELPYEKTLLLDTDTIVSDGFEKAFQVAKSADIAATTIAEDQFRIPTVPDALPEYNTGVILFNRSQATSEFIDLWKDLYKNYLEDGVRMNQPAFREAIHKSNIQNITLPTEYNCRANFGGYLTKKVKILHGAFDDPASVLSELNRYDTPRVFFNEDGELRVKRVNTTNNRFTSGSL